MSIDEMLANLIEMISALNPAEMPGDEWFHYATTLTGIAHAQAAQRQADAAERSADLWAEQVGMWRESQERAAQMQREREQKERERAERQSHFGE